MATAHRIDPPPPLDGDTRADVCVIGGGFTGLAAALAAAEAGFSVILLEAHAIGWGASGRNGGQMIPGLRWNAPDLIDTFGTERAGLIFRTAIEARDRVHARIRRHAIDCDLRAGHFTAAWKPSHLDAMRCEATALHERMDYPGVRIVERSDVRSHVASTRYHGGLFDPAGGHLHPLSYAFGLARAARQAGVTIHENTVATGVDRGTPARVATARGTVTAEHVVLACDSDMNAVAPDIGKYAMPIANYNIATAPLGAERAAALIPGNAAIADSRFVLNYFRRSADDRVIFGGGEKYTARPPRDIAAFVGRFLVETFPSLAGTPIDFAWGGMVGVTMNRLPHFGRSGSAFFAHGYSGQGVLLATLAGELIAEAMTGTAARFDVFASLPHRPFPGGRLLRHPLHVAGMLYYALKDRL